MAWQIPNAQQVHQTDEPSRETPAQGGDASVTHAPTTAWLNWPPGTLPQANDLQATSYASPHQPPWPSTGTASAVVQHHEGLPVAMLPGFTQTVLPHHPSMATAATVGHGFSIQVVPQPPSIQSTGIDREQVQQAFDRHADLFDQHPLVDRMFRQVLVHNDAAFMPMLKYLLVTNPAGIFDVERLADEPERLIMEWLSAQPKIKALVSTTATKAIEQLKAEPGSRYQNFVDPSTRPQDGPTVPLTSQNLAIELVRPEVNEFRELVRREVKDLLRDATFFSDQQGSLKDWLDHLANRTSNKFLIDDLRSFVARKLGEECDAAQRDRRAGTNP